MDIVKGLWEVWSVYTSSGKGDNIAHKVLVLCIEKYIFSFESLTRLLQLNKEYARLVNVRLQKFYDIPYLSYRSKIDEEQKKMIEENRLLLRSHSSWFLACCIKGCVDLLDESEEHSRYSCLRLKCPPLCKRLLNPYDVLPLVHKDTKIRKYEHIANRIIESLFQDVDRIPSLIPWFICEGWMNKTFLRCLSKEKDYIINCFFYFYSIPRPTQEDDEVWKRFSSLIDTNTKESLVRSMNTMESAYYIIEEPDIDRENRITLLKKGLEKSNLIQQKIHQISIWMNRYYKDMIYINTYERKSYLIVNEPTTFPYLITHCVHLLSIEIGIPIPFPLFVPFSLFHGMYHLPDGTTNKIEDPYHKYKGVLPLALFTVITYVFGIYETKVLFGDKGIFPIQFTRLYQEDYIPITDIVHSLGGRKTSKYMDYRDRAIDIFLLVRRQYSVIALYTDALCIPRESLNKRLLPKETEEKAIDRFTEVMSRSVKKGIGWWKYIGY